MRCVKIRWSPTRAMKGGDILSMPVVFLDLKSFATIYVTRENFNWKFVQKFQHLTVFFTTSPAQYELLFNSGRFWDRLILINQKNLPRRPTFEPPINFLRSDWPMGCKLNWGRGSGSRYCKQQFLSAMLSASVGPILSYWTRCVGPILSYWTRWLFLFCPLLICFQFLSLLE